MGSAEAETYSLHIWVRAFAVFSDEVVDPRRDNGQRYRGEVEHSIVESAEPRRANARSRTASKTTAVAMMHHKRLMMRAKSNRNSSSFRRGACAPQTPPSPRQIDVSTE
jgi:hypothetical protein